jgi:hypothetical protein
MLTLCKGGTSQPQKHRAADRQHAIKAKSQWPETKRYFLVSGMKLASARGIRCPGPQLPPAGKGPIRTSVRVLRRALLLYFSTVLAAWLFELGF